MKRNEMKALFLIAALSAATNLSAQQKHSLETVWQTDSVFQYCDGAVAAHNNEYLFIANWVGDSNAKDNNGIISKVGWDGKIIDLEWVKGGMDSPKDICRYKNLLYAADMDKVDVIDIDKAKVVQQIHIEGTTLIHFVAVDTKGVVYASDMSEGKVFRIKNGKPELYLDSLGYVAGMLALDDGLIVMTGPKLGTPGSEYAGKILKVDKKKRITTIATGLERNLDGIQQVKKDEYLVSCWDGMIFYVFADGTHEVLRDTRNQRMPTGLFCFLPQTQMLYVCSINRNILFAFKLK